MNIREIVVIVLEIKFNIETQLTHDIRREELELPRKIHRKKIFSIASVLSFDQVDMVQDTLVNVGLKCGPLFASVSNKHTLAQVAMTPVTANRKNGIFARTHSPRWSVSATSSGTSCSIGLPTYHANFVSGDLVSLILHSSPDSEQSSIPGANLTSGSVWIVELAENCRRSHSLDASEGLTVPIALDLEYDSAFGLIGRQ